MVMQNLSVLLKVLGLNFGKLGLGAETLGCQEKVAVIGETRSDT